MQFLNVYPKRIWATLNAQGAFEGQFTFDLEQYGLMLEELVCEVTISPLTESEDEWHITVKPLFDIDMPHFNKFVDTLNHYVFEVLGFRPDKSSVGGGLPSVKLFFDSIYFDMSGAEPVVEKIKPQP